jgi:hypothetical protein
MIVPLNVTKHEIPECACVPIRKAAQPKKCKARKTALRIYGGSPIHIDGTPQIHESTEPTIRVCESAIDRCRSIKTVNELSLTWF